MLTATFNSFRLAIKYGLNLYIFTLVKSLFIERVLV